LFLVKAYKIVNDYTICFEDDEFEQLPESSLECTLRDMIRDEELDKKITLIMSGARQLSDGITVSYLPEATNWEDVTEIRVAIDEFAYRHIKEQGVFGTRYDGIGNKIEIHRNYPFNR
jgi:hypothetical protein